MRKTSDLRKQVKNIEEIDQILSTQHKPHRSLLPRKTSVQESPCFLSVTREKREEVQKVNFSEAPSPTKYSPNYLILRPTSASNVKLRPKSGKPKEKFITLPTCVDDLDYECKYPHKFTNFSTENYRITCTEYLNSLEEKAINRKKIKQKNRHNGYIAFNKQSARKGLPLNQMHESIREEKSLLKSKSYKGPNFSAYKSRPELFVSEPNDVNYNPNPEYIKVSLGRGVLSFDKMSSRNSIFDTENSTSSPVLENLQASYDRVLPRSRVRTSFIGKRDHYDVYPAQKPSSAYSPSNFRLMSPQSFISSFDILL